MLVIRLRDHRLRAATDNPQYSLGIADTALDLSESAFIGSTLPAKKAPTLSTGGSGRTSESKVEVLCPLPKPTGVGTAWQPALIGALDQLGNPLNT